tara:strand:+ start:4293 stop:4553 length:261 start_codon:yes stop_codon:yes gene_type:complete
MKKKNDIEKTFEKISFEDALNELEKITNSFEEGETSLEDAVSLYERGVILKKHCEKKLNEANKKINEIKLNNPNLIDEENKNKKKE